MRFNFADDLMPSPDGKWIVFTEQFEVYLAPLSEPVGDAPVDAGAKGQVLLRGPRIISDGRQRCDREW